MHSKIVNDSNVSELFSGEIQSLFNIFKLIIENTEKEKNISIGVVVSDDFEIGASEEGDQQFAVTIGLPIFREFSLRILKNDVIFLQKSLQEFDKIVPIIQNFKYYQKIIFYTSIYQLFGHEIAHIALGHCHDDWQPTSTEQLRGEEGHADQCAGFLLPNMIVNIQAQLQHYLPKLPTNVCSNFCLYIILFSSIYSYKVMSDMFPSETENYPAWTTRSLMSQISLLTEMNKLGHPKEKLVDNFKFIYCTLHGISNVEFAQQLMATDTEWSKDQK